MKAAENVQADNDRSSTRIVLALWGESKQKTKKSKAMDHKPYFSGILVSEMMTMNTMMHIDRT